MIIESTQVESPVSEAPRAGPERKAEGATRLISLDAFRGMVMVLMLAEHMRLPEVARAFPHSGLWRLIAFNTQHVEWQGCSLHDLCMPELLRDARKINTYHAKLFVPLEEIHP